MADDKKNKKTGLGVDAFFPAVEEGPDKETAAPVAEGPPRKLEEKKKEPEKKRAPRAQAKRPRVKAKEEEEIKKAPQRRTAWLREDHLNRLEVLKVRERERRRKDSSKRVSVAMLIDEAIERYLAEMEK